MAGSKTPDLVPENVDKSSCVRTFLRRGFVARGGREGMGNGEWGIGRGRGLAGARSQRREEVHFKGTREAGGRAEGDVHVTVEDLDDIRA